MRTLGLVLIGIGFVGGSLVAVLHGDLSVGGQTYPISGVESGPGSFRFSPWASWAW